MEIVQRAFLLWMLALVAIGCTLRQPPQASSPIGMPLAELLEHIQHGEPVLERLPAPQRVTSEEGHDADHIGRVRTLHYPGLTLSVSQTGTGQTRISQLTVTGPQYRTAEGLHVGSMLQDLSDALGEADRLEGDDYVYLGTGPAPDTVRFGTDNERISRMQWEFYGD